MTNVRTERGIHAASTHEHESSVEMNPNVPQQSTLKRPEGRAPAEARGIYAASTHEPEIALE
jgi:hypothetical protein